MFCQTINVFFVTFLLCFITCASKENRKHWLTLDVINDDYSSNSTYLMTDKLNDSDLGLCLLCTTSGIGKDKDEEDDEYYSSLCKLHVSQDCNAICCRTDRLSNCNESNLYTLRIKPMSFVFENKHDLIVNSNGTRLLFYFKQLDIIIGWTVLNDVITMYGNISHRSYIEINNELYKLSKYIESSSNSQTNQTRKQDDNQSFVFFFFLCFYMFLCVYYKLFT